jgi:hypothetical protein
MLFGVYIERQITIFFFLIFFFIIIFFQSLENCFTKKASYGDVICLSPVDDNERVADL